MKTIRQIGSLAFVLGLFVTLFAGLPWKIIVEDDPVIPWWLRIAIFALLGGILIGLIEAFWSAYFTVEYKDVAAYSILVLVLIFRPTGLLGKPDIEKV